jgi:predicted RNA methylase
VTWDLRHGDWRDVLADVECDALITDPPYGARNHRGHDAGVQGKFDSANRQTIGYTHWTPEDVNVFVEEWAQRVRGWMCVQTSHDLIPAWERAFGEAGRYSFAPLPCVMRGMTCRMQGDGPSSWCTWLMVARPRCKPWSKWGSLPGAYVVKPLRNAKFVGAKPLDLMVGIARDYSRPGDLVCDPCAGTGTTLLAAEMLGRNSIGAEIDADTHAMAVKRLTGAREQTELAL